MTNNYAEVFSLFEKIINESNSESVVDYEKVRANSDSFLNDLKKDDLHASGSSKNTSNKEKEFDESEDEDEDEEESEEIDTPDESPSTINLSDASDYEKFVDNLNQFRAAHSFSSSDIKEELTAYFDKLKPEEKKVLHIFIKGLIQVTMMDVKGKAAYSPSDLKFDIIKTGSATSEKKKSLARNVDLKKKAKEKDLNSPIKVGESKQDKSLVYKVLNENRY